MSSVARNYAFIVKVRDEKKTEATISKAKVEECKKLVEPYLKDRNGKKV